jgi:hypothetical protein
VGFYSVKFSKTGYDSYTENNVQILMNQTSNINASITEITDGFGEVSGFVADAVNQVPLNNAEVIIEGTSFTTITSADGLYSFADVPANNYTISCSKTDFEDYSQSIIIIANEEINADFLLLPEGSTTYGSINGIVTNTDGEPIPNVVCAVVGLYISALSDEDGSYEISLIPGGTFDISFTKPGYETVIIENIVIENGAATSLNTQIQQISGTGNLICYVENVQEFPINGALIEILDTTFSGSTGIVGMCSIQQIPTGIYTIRISKTGYQTQERENVEILAELPQTLYITLLN